MGVCSDLFRGLKNYKKEFDQNKLEHKKPVRLSTMHFKELKMELNVGSHFKVKDPSTAT